jgi:hypothetical protein
MALIITFFFLAILGFMIIMKRRVLNSKAGWSVLALWMLSIAILSFTIPPYIKDFSETGRHTVVERYAMHNQTAVLRLNDVGDDEFDMISLKITSHADTMIRLDKEFFASGSSRSEATENAKMINYGMEARDSVLLFDSNIQFNDGAKFRQQELEMTLYLPEGQKFIIGEEMDRLIGSYLYREGFSNRYLENHVWQFEDEELQCLTCPVEEKKQKEDSDWDITGFQRTYDMDDFSEISIKNAFSVYVKQSPRYSVIVNGRKRDVDEVVVDKMGNELSVTYKGGVIKPSRNNEKVKVYVTCPSLKNLDLGRAVRLYAYGFDESFMDLNLTGAAVAEMDIEVRSLLAKIEGASKLQLEGSCIEMEMEVLGASTLEAFDFEAEDVELKAQSASSAEVYASERLRVQSSGASKVLYHGDARVEIDKSGSSMVRKD